ncbi:hypothetical protein NLX83_00290 [Allokutzneria sp. A3M-2-11 16]|uniref:hypothetical protein n=1 Tax=Allokutzneria sp. A3M-2-11 16 TaxID=2962043 RepID=UPI0020B7D7BB|nr:hypothetical protein [Allokutzneria sp. A3M-2-11 16]MCP3797686.1 hypothetical protein [Allokutzneria sp. A3M-2-11 16]
MKRPVELWATLACLVGAQLVFLIAAIVRWTAEGGADVVMTPLVLLVLSAVAAGSILARIGIARAGAIAVAVFAALLHLLIVLGDGPVLARVLSGVLGAAQVYAVVLLSTGPMRKFLERR